MFCRSIAVPNLRVHADIPIVSVKDQLLLLLVHIRYIYEEAETSFQHDSPEV
jgi:hypothetical protein